MCGVMPQKTHSTKLLLDDSVSHRRWHDLPSAHTKSCVCSGIEVQWRRLQLLTRSDEHTGSMISVSNTSRWVYASQQLTASLTACLLGAVRASRTH